MKNPEKTSGSDLVTAYQCNPSIAYQEFLFAKRQYAVITGRERKDNDVIAHHLRQSFKPGESTPEMANRIGYDLAMSLTKGKPAVYNGSFRSGTGATVRYTQKAGREIIRINPETRLMSE